MPTYRIANWPAPIHAATAEDAARTVAASVARQTWRGGDCGSVRRSERPDRTHDCMIGVRDGVAGGWCPRRARILSVTVTEEA
jgi:hypothetical protein